MTIQTLMRIQPYLPETVFNQLVLAAPKVYPLIQRIKAISDKRSTKLGALALAVTIVTFFILSTKDLASEQTGQNPERRIRRGWTEQLQLPIWILGWLLPISD